MQYYTTLGYLKQLYNGVFSLSYVASYNKLYNGLLKTMISTALYRLHWFATLASLTYIPQYGIGTRLWNGSLTT